MNATVLPAAPRKLRIVILGLSITSSWGNGHATTYRSLMRALCRRGHEVLFLECDKPWYREHRDLRRPPFGTVRLYDDVVALRRRWRGEQRHRQHSGREAPHGLGSSRNTRTGNSS